MRLIAILALIAIARCRRNYKTWRTDQQHFSQTFRNLRSSPEFLRIMRSPSLTYFQQKQAISRLALKYGVLVEMEEYIEASDARLREMKTKSKRIAAELPRGLEEYWNIIEDPYKTVVEKHYALKKIKLQNPAEEEIWRAFSRGKEYFDLSAFAINAAPHFQNRPYQRVRNISPLVLSETRHHRGSSYGTSTSMGISDDFNMGLEYKR